MSNIYDNIKSFKEKIKNGSVVGPFCKTLDRAFLETIGYSGFDFCIIDMEHGPVTINKLQDLIRACYSVNLLPIVRVVDISEDFIGRALDSGAAGVQVPMVSDKESAKKVIKLAKFSPLGDRGVCRFVKAAQYSTMERFQYFKEANETM